MRIFADCAPEYAWSVEVATDPLLESKKEWSKSANLKTVLEPLVPSVGAGGWTVPPVPGLGVVVVPLCDPPARRPRVRVERTPLT
jgi:hypothetical protein